MQSLSRRRFLVRSSLGTAGILTARAAAAPEPAVRADGYHGIWFTLGQKSEFGDKYSGGLGTYTANHVPMAVYAKEVDRTFFVYGGTLPGKRHLLAMISWYDHKRGVVPKPAVVMDKQGVNDPHDNPSLSLDGGGHLWVFVSGRGRGRPGTIFRSVEPYSIDRFEKISESEFTYPQPWWIDGRGFCLLFTKYTNGRELYLRASADGRTWSPDRKFAGIGGHYQTSAIHGSRILTAFNRHPGGNVDKRTGLYYMQTPDVGESWQDVRGRSLDVPLADPQSPALVRKFADEGKLVYIHDVSADPDGRPVILFTTSRDHRPGPPGDPRDWNVTRWTGETWEFARLCPANHNYSTGALYTPADGPWRVVGPTDPGPQPVGSGGEIAQWTSDDRGSSWRKSRNLTLHSPANHNYVRRPLHAHPDFASYWADGNPDTFSPSSLYFANAAATAVRRLPRHIASDLAEPELLAPA